MPQSWPAVKWRKNRSRATGKDRRHSNGLWKVAERGSAAFGMARTLTARGARVVRAFQRFTRRKCVEL